MYKRTTYNEEIFKVRKIVFSRGEHTNWNPIHNNSPKIMHINNIQMSRFHLCVWNHTHIHTHSNCFTKKRGLVFKTKQGEVQGNVWKKDKVGGNYMTIL